MKVFRHSDPSKYHHIVTARSMPRGAALSLSDNSHALIIGHVISSALSAWKSHSLVPPPIFHLVGDSALVFGVFEPVVSQDGRQC